MASFAFTLAGLTPALLASPVAFDVERTVRAWDSEEAMDAGEAPRFGANWQPSSTPHTLPLAKYESSDPVVSSAWADPALVQFTVSGLTPSLPVSFELTAEDVASVEMLSSTSGDMELDLYLKVKPAVYSSEEARNEGTSPLAFDTIRYTSLPASVDLGGMISFSLAPITPDLQPVLFEVYRRIHGYYSAQDRTQGIGRVFTVRWMPIEDPAPFEAPATAPNEPGTPVIGSARMLSGAAATFSFLLRANGEVEGDESGTFAIQATVQPLKPGEAAAAADLTQGKASVRIYTSTRLKTVDEGQADRIEIMGRQYEVVSCEEWGNTRLAHFKAIARAFNPMALP